MTNTNYIPRVHARRQSDRHFLVIVACMFLLTLLLGVSIGVYAGARYASSIIEANSVTAN
jgi:VIT1/CCC1 family predicted Fe2+/Mn2+ transporter